MTRERHVHLIVPVVPRTSITVENTADLPIICTSFSPCIRKLLLREYCDMAEHSYSALNFIACERARGSILLRSRLLL